MKKRLLLAAFSLGGIMFAQTPTQTVDTINVTTNATVVQTTEPVVTAPPVVESKPGVFSIGADLRTRSELDNGQRTLVKSGDSPENTVFSRARLNFEYKKDKLALKFSPQMIRVWGETNSIRLSAAPSSNNSKTIPSDFDVYEVWAQYSINPNWAIKVGRMPLSYDDERLFGALDWQMQGRNFDAAKLVYTKGKAKLELVGTYNNDNSGFGRDANGEEIYTVVDAAETTKSLQLMHYENILNDKFKFTLIALHNVLQLAGTVPTHNSLFTFGINPKYKVSDKFTIYGSTYFQGGKDSSDRTKSAFQYSANLEFKPTSKLTSTLGTEVLSGSNTTAKINNAFSPLYGTNHKFNGYMDYFFVGNHFNTVGLNDYYLKSNLKIKEKGVLAVNIHGFLTNQPLVGASKDNYLGTELDFIYTHKVSEVFSYNIGYSQMLASDNMRILKAKTNYNDNQSWAWVALIFNPKLFTTTIQ